MNHFATNRMKSCLGFTGICLGCLAAALFPVTAQPATQPKTAAPPAKTSSLAKAAAGSVSNSAEPDIPLSQFVMPTNPKAGRDPFFPNSMHPYASKQTTTNRAAVAEVTLSLNGITPGKLVMINGRTFSEGEEGDVKTTAGSRHVRCLKIKEDSAIVEMEGERRELRLRQGL